MLRAIKTGQQGPADQIHPACSMSSLSTLPGVQA